MQVNNTYYIYIYKLSTICKGNFETLTMYNYKCEVCGNNTPYTLIVNTNERCDYCSKSMYLRLTILQANFIKYGIWNSQNRISFFYKIK